MNSEAALNPANFGEPNIPTGDTTKQQIERRKTLVRPLRTYQDDVAAFVRKEKVSTADIVLAEQRKRIEELQNAPKNTTDFQTEARLRESKRRFSLKVGGILILIGAVIISGTFFFFNPLSEKDSGVPTDSAVFISPIRTNSTIEINSTNRISTEIKNVAINNIDNPPALSDGEIVELAILSEKSLVTDGKNNTTLNKLPVADFINILELRPSAELARSLGQKYLFGIMGVFGGSVPVMLFEIADFERVFSNMLSWESSLWREINDFFFATLGVNDFQVKEFEDVIISNRDARAIVSDSGQILFFYTFIDEGYLLMSSDKSTVAEIVNKLNLQRLVR